MSQRLTILTEIDTHALAQADALYELGTLWNSPLTIISHCRLYGGDEKKPRVEEQVNHLPIRPNRIEIMITLRQSEMR